MKLKTFLIVGCLGGLFTLSSCTAPTNVKDYSAYVNPFIGTGGHGHTFPGAVVQWFLSHTRQWYRLLRLWRCLAHANRR